MTGCSLTLEKSAVAKGRGRVYRLLAAVYLKEAGPELLDILLQDEVSVVLKELGVDIGRTVPVKSPGGDKAFLDSLAEEYAALFVLPGGLPPYESVRTKGLLCQEPEWEVREFYKRSGLLLQDGSRLFADHIGIELDFMGYLAYTEADSWDKKDEEQALRWLGFEREFFKGHLGRWVFGFLDDLDRLAFHPFYRGISVLTRKFMEIEREDLEA